jgi:hypothetical protein
MRVLQILKSEPDEEVRSFMEAFADDDVTTVPLYEGDVDWEALVDAIFSHDKVVCWW